MGELPRSHALALDPMNNRRAQPDRRSRPTSPWAAFRGSGRRRGFRRVGEGRNQYVDLPSRRIVLLTLLIVGSSTLDAVFTLLHLQGGAREANPIMDKLILASVDVFIAVKTWVTGLGILFLAVHQNFRLSWIALHGLAGIYVLLLTYHACLFFHG